MQAKTLRSLFPLSLALFIASGAPALIEVRIDNPIDDDEIVEIKKYLEIAISHQKRGNWKSEAEKELAILKRYDSILCTDRNDLLSCNLHRYPIVRNVEFEGVPILILEKELKKHIPIRSGQIINNADTTFTQAIPRSENAIKSHLEREGVIDPKITTTIVPVPNVPASDILFTVESGRFLRVKDVHLNNEMPIDPEIFTGPFRRMCSNIRFAFEGILQGTKACYNREIEREKIEDLEDTLSSLGYVESHVSVERQVIDDPIAKSKNIHLIVNVLLGPKLSVEFTGPILDSQILDASPFVRLLRSITGVEFFSRAFNLPPPHALYPEDETILINQLRESLTFKASHVIDDSEIQASSEAIKEVLRSRGYAQAMIETDSTVATKENNSVKVTFKITPGTPTSISSIRVIGAKPFSYEDISRKMDMLLGVRTAFFSGHFTESALKHDIALMNRFLHNEGFAAASATAVMEQTDAGIDLIYLVDMGKGRLVKSIVFDHDDEKITREYLGNYTSCRNQQITRNNDKTILKCDPYPFVESDVESEVIKLASLYTLNGYLKANPTSHIEDNNGEVTIEFKFDPKEMHRAKVAQLLVDGNISTYRSVIERELGSKNVANGSNFIPLRIDDGLRRLRSYGSFSRVTLEPILKPDSQDEYYLSMQLVEKPTLALDLNARFDSDRLFSIGVALDDRNLFGTLLNLNTSLKFGLFFGRESTFANIVSWPRFFGLPMEIKFKAPEMLYEKLVKNSPTGVNARHAQLKASVQFDWLLLGLLRPSIELQFRADKWQFENDLPFSEQSFFDNPWASIASLDGLIDVLGEPGSLRAVFKPSLAVVKIDNVFDPRLGYSVKGGLELSSANLTTDLPYAIFDFRGVGYLPLGPFTLASKLEFRRGIIDNPALNWWVLQEEADFKLLGGINGPRAYERDTLGIYGTLLNKYGPIRSKGRPIIALHPGDFSLFTSVELRFPLVEKAFIGKLNGAVFADLGYIGLCKDSFFCLNNYAPQPEPNRSNPYQLGISVGVGLRLVLPVGPLLLDYAISPTHLGSGLFGRQSNLTFQLGYMY